MLEPVKIDPRPPETLPTNPPSPELRPAPAMPESPNLEGAKKPWFQSKTIVGILVAVFWFIAPPIASFLGIDISFLRDGFQAPEDFVPLAALFVALWGRITATKRIG